MEGGLEVRSSVLSLLAEISLVAGDCEKSCFSSRESLKFEISAIASAFLSGDYEFGRLLPSMSSLSDLIDYCILYEGASFGFLI